jgi:signal transduction histidine kinase
MTMRTGEGQWTDPARARILSSWQGDVAIAVTIGVAQVVGTYFAGRHQPDRYSWDALGVFLLVVGPAALLVRRRWPRAVMAVVLASTLAYWVIGYVRGPVFFALIAALVALVMAGRRRAAIAALGAGFLGFLWLGAVLDRDASPSIGAQLGLAAWLALLLGAAEAVRGRRQRALGAAQLREEEARRRVSDERLRIARELHDVVAHNISLINVQAATTLHLLDDRDSRAAAALATIKDVSKETLIELRSVLGALRQVDEEAPRAPAPSLTQIEELSARATATGVVTHVEVYGNARPLPVAADLAAYRIVQEALTNVARHSTTRVATVSIEYGADDVIVQVDDDGRTNGTVVPGNGLTGMTERAVALGGNVHAGPRAGGGFRVRAWLPAGESA